MLRYWPAILFATSDNSLKILEIDIFYLSHSFWHSICYVIPIWAIEPRIAPVVRVGAYFHFCP
jgi:hypothetical protein